MSKSLRRLLLLTSSLLVLGSTSSIGSLGCNPPYDLSPNTYDDGPSNTDANITDADITVKPHYVNNYLMSIPGDSLKEVIFNIPRNASESEFVGMPPIRLGELTLMDSKYKLVKKNDGFYLVPKNTKSPIVFIPGVVGSMPGSIGVSSQDLGNKVITNPGFALTDNLMVDENRKDWPYANIVIEGDNGVMVYQPNNTFKTPDGTNIHFVRNNDDTVYVSVTDVSGIKQIYSVKEGTLIPGTNISLLAVSYFHYSNLTRSYVFEITDSNVDYTKRISTPSGSFAIGVREHPYIEYINPVIYMRAVNESKIVDSADGQPVDYAVIRLDLTLQSKVKFKRLPDVLMKSGDVISLDSNTTIKFIGIQLSKKDSVPDLGDLTKKEKDDVWKHWPKLARRSGGAHQLNKMTAKESKIPSSQNRRPTLRRRKV